MDEEKNCVEKGGDSFHLSNWKKLIYIMAEIEKNVDKDSQQPQSQNINQETVSNSLWSWPWKIHKGKVISSKKDTTLNDGTQESFDNKQSKSFRYQKTTSSTNELAHKNETNKDEFDVLCGSFKESNSIGTVKPDNIEEEARYTIRSALGLNSNTNAVAMGIILPLNNFKECMPCHNSNNTTTPLSRSTPPTTLMSSFDDISDHCTQPSYNADDNNEFGIRKNNNANTPTIIVSSPSSLFPNKCIFSVGSSRNKDGENFILSKKKFSTSCNNSTNLYGDECGTAYESKYMVDMKVQTFKKNDNVSQQTLNKLGCDTETTSHKPYCYNGVHLVGNEDTKEVEGTSNSFSSSVVTEKCRTEECRHCEKKAEEKHLLKQQETRSTAKKSTNHTFEDVGLTVTNQSAAAVQQNTQLEYLRRVNNTNLCSGNCSVKKFDHHFCTSCNSELECKYGSISLEDAIDSSQERSTSINTSIENLSEGYLKHRKFELH